MKDSSKKLKLVCSFNGEFRRRKPSEIFRYTGGETRIISVDPTTLTYSKLRSLITQLFRVANSNEFKLKYQLPGSETGDSSSLILLADDDDVSCMVEEYYEKVALHGNKFSRLWVFVFNGNVDDPLENSCGKGDFDWFRVLRESLRFKGENLGFKNFLDATNCGKNPNHNYNHNHSHNHSHNNGRKKISSSDRCLRKLVLKQQLVLAKQKDQIEYTDCSAKLENYDQPLIDLGPGSCDLITAKVDVNNNANSGRKFDCKEGDFGGLNSTRLVSNSCPLSLRDSNLLEERNRNSGSTSAMESCEGMGDSSQNKQDLNMENPLPYCLDDQNALNSHMSCDDRGIRRDSTMNQFHRGHGISGHCGIRSHHFRKGDLRNQGIGYSCHYGSHCMSKLGGNISVGAKCYPGLGVSKQGQAMRFHHSNSSVRPLSGPPHRTKVVETRKLIDPNKASRKQANKVSVTQSQVYQPRILEEPLIDFSEEPIGVKNNAAKGELRGNCLTDSINLSSCNPSMSSSKVATLKLSYLGSEVSASLQIDQLKVLDPTVEGSNKSALHSIVDIIAKWDKSCSLQEDMQDAPPASPNSYDKVDSRNNQIDSNIIAGIPSDLAALFTDLSTRGLQLVVVQRLMFPLLQTIQYSDLEYIKELGSGNYGTVYHGKWKGSDVAVKTIKPSCFNGDTKMEDRLVADFWKEAFMLGQLHHPNIVAFYGVVTDGPITNLATVTEYMVNGSLKQVLQRKDRTIDRRKRLIIAMDAAFGMEYLHEKNIVHFDLKSHNFLVNMKDPQRPVCKIGDLGLSKLKRRTMVSGGVRGTIPWMAPELLNTSTNLVTEKVDVYSFGIVMWELLTGEEPYAGMRSGDIIAQKVKGTLQPEIPSWCDPAWRSLMERCWSPDPKSRPSFSEIAKELRAISGTINIK
ncbi:hypothetical protein SOVF_176870 [Spinacia oleracea]|nr:hypothetical protein SOVF_176870 [Spinacia oleracea]